MSAPLALLVALPGIIFLMLLFLTLIRRQGFARKLHETNEIVGFYLTIVGGLYGVFLGFMVLVVWTRFDQAETLVEQEATAISNVFLVAGNLRDPARTAVRTEVEKYTYQVIQQEWPQMEAGRYKAAAAFQQFVTVWHEVGRIVPKDSRDGVMLDQMLTQMASMNEYRRLRLLANEKSLPGVLWLVLIGGAVITLGSTAFLGVERFPIHALKSALLTTLIFLTLYAIYEIDSPFQGAVRVSPEPYQRSVLFFNEIRAQEAQAVSPPVK